MILLVNKNNLFDERLLDELEMVEYVNYEEKTLYVERETFEHFMQLKAHLRVDDIIIDIKDAYRSLETQENIFVICMNKYGMDYAEENEAMPGTSEHHTGLAIDFAICKDGKWVCDKNDMEDDSIIQKIHKDLKYFGFIIRFPKGKKNITGYDYDPFHIRYIGDYAMKIGDLTLEEFINIKKKIE